MTATDTLESIYAQLSAGKNPPSPVNDPYVLTSVLTENLADIEDAITKKLDLTGDASNTKITVLGQGAVARSLTLCLQDFVINVKNYGAKGDNSTDDTAAIQAAVTFAATMLTRGAKIFFPPGIYVISAAITVPKSRPIAFQGQGIGASVIRQVNPTADGIVYNNGTSNTSDADYLLGGQWVSDLTIEAGAGFQTAGFFGKGSTGTGLKFTHGNNGSGSQNISINNFANGIVLLSCWYTTHVNFRVQFHIGDAIYIDKGPDGTTAGGNRLIGFVTSNNGFSDDPSNSHSLRIRASGGDYIIGGDMVKAQIPILIDPPAGSQVAYTFLDQVLADSGLTDGWVFDATAGGIIAVRMTNCWAGFNNGNGMVTKGAIAGLSSTNMALRENGLRGWYHLGGTGIDLVNPDISHNSRLSSLTYPGVEVVGGGNFGILGGRNGNQESGGIGTGDGQWMQAEAIKFSGTVINFRIVDHDMTYVGTGKSIILFDETKIINYKMSGNLPVTSYGINLSERQGVMAADFIAAGTAPSYLGSRTVQASPNILPFCTTTPVLVARIDIQLGTPPGAGQSFTYQLVKNGTAVGPTAVISGNSTYVGLVYPGIVLAPNDNYEVKMTPSSSSAAAGVHRALISLDR